MAQRYRSRSRRYGTIYRVEDGSFECGFYPTFFQAEQAGRDMMKCFKKKSVTLVDIVTNEAFYYNGLDVPTVSTLNAQQALAR